MVQNGILDRQKLANMVFSDPERLGELNAIIHPMVRDRMAEMFREYVSADPRAIVIEDSPLLIETGRAYVPQFLIVITSPDNLRIERLVRDRGMTEQHAQARINTQLEDEERLPFADAVIENTGTVEELEAQVDKIIARLREFEENVVTETVPEAKGCHVMNGERLLGKLAHTGTEARVDGMDVVVPAETEEMHSSPRLLGSRRRWLGATRRRSARAGPPGGNTLGHCPRRVLSLGLMRPVTDLVRAEAPFDVVSEFTPSGDQPTAIADLTERINAGEKDIVLLGATGTGKSATTAWLIEQIQRPTLILEPNKTLAAQMASEFRELLQQRGRVLRLVLRLLPAGSLRSADRHLHRERLVDK